MLQFLPWSRISACLQANKIAHYTAHVQRRAPSVSQSIHLRLKTPKVSNTSRLYVRVFPFDCMGEAYYTERHHKPLLRDILFITKQDILLITKTEIFSSKCPVP
jgi:hypothetical protein